METRPNFKCKFRTVCAMAEVALDARLNGHTPKVFRFDQAPELRSKTLENRVNKELQMQVELTPRSHHEGVGRVEGHNDLSLIHI